MCSAVARSVLEIRLVRSEAGSPAAPATSVWDGRMSKGRTENRMHITATLFAGALLFPIALAAQMSSGAIDGQQALTGMDSRRALPLPPMMANHQKQNMRDHLVAVQEIIAATVTADFAAVERAAGRIGYSEQMGQMCTHMGAAAPGFAEQALLIRRVNGSTRRNGPACAGSSFGRVPADAAAYAGG